MRLDPRAPTPSLPSLRRQIWQAFTDAAAYGAKRKADAKTPLNAKHEALLPALAGAAPVFFAAHRADDIATALRLAAEFKLKPVLALGTEAYRLIPELKAAGTPVVVHPTMQRAASSIETTHAYAGTAAALADAGIPIVLCTGFEGYVPKTRVLRFEAAMAAAHGLGHERALKAVTADAAKLLGVADRVGTIEVGKVADLVLYDGDPFEHATHVTHTVLSGKVVYDRAEYLKLPLDRRIIPLVNGGAGAGCCLAARDVWFVDSAGQAAYSRALLSPSAAPMNPLCDQRMLELVAVEKDGSLNSIHASR